MIFVIASCLVDIDIVVLWVSLQMSWLGKSSESVQCAMLKACDACADMGQL